MKRTLLLALSLCLSVVSIAQSETPIPKDSPAKDGTGYMPVFQDSTLVFNIVQTVTCYSNDYDYDPDYLGGCFLTIPIRFQRYDSIFGNTYNVFGFGADDLYVREDTSTGMIFRYYPELDTEVVECDMSLMPGDTFWMPDFLDKFPEGVWLPDEYYYTEMSDKFTVVDSVSIVDGRKVIYLRPFNESLFFSSLYFPEFVPSLKFIEGIGPTYGPFGKIRFSLEPPLGLLLCVHYGDSLVYMNNPVLGCYQSGGDVPEYPESVMQLYPNPASRMLNVEFEGVENPQGVFTISDIAGIVVLSQECNSTVTQLDVSRLKSGIYVVGFRNGKGYIVKKFVKI